MGVVDEQTRLEVLAVVGEVQPEQLGVSAGRTEPHATGQPHHVTAEGDSGVAQHGILTQRCVMAADVHGVIGPVGDRHHPQRRAVPTRNSMLSA